MFSLKNYTLAGFERGSSVPKADAMATAARAWIIMLRLIWRTQSSLKSIYIHVPTLNSSFLSQLIYELFSCNIFWDGWTTVKLIFTVAEIELVNPIISSAWSQSYDRKLQRQRCKNKQRC
jgi:hypothetical protein